jgi:outer membrane protein assembly factor BamA
VQVRPRITEINVEGNNKVSDNKLKKKITVKVGDPLDEEKLFTDVQEMKKLYEKYGYSDTKVKYVLNIDEATGHGTVTFQIEESAKVKITLVSFVGADNFRKRNCASRSRPVRIGCFRGSPAAATSSRMSLTATATG